MCVVFLLVCLFSSVYLSLLPERNRRSKRNTRARTNRMSAGRVSSFITVTLNGTGKCILKNPSLLVLPDSLGYHASKSCAVLYVYDLLICFFPCLFLNSVGYFSLGLTLFLFPWNFQVFSEFSNFCILTTSPRSFGCL